MSQAAGKLNHWILLESLETTNDSNGDAVEEWISQGGTWAEFVPSSAREFVSASAMQSKVIGRFTIRSHPTIQPTWRILFRQKYYNVEGVLSDPVTGLEYMTLPVSEHIRADE